MCPHTHFSGSNLADVMSHVGWSSPSTVQYYLKLSSVLRAGAPADLLSKNIHNIVRLLLYMRSSITLEFYFRLSFWTVVYSLKKPVSFLVEILRTGCLGSFLFWIGLSFGWLVWVFWVSCYRCIALFCGRQTSVTQRSASKTGVNSILITIQSQTLLTILYIHYLQHDSCIKDNVILTLLIFFITFPFLETKIHCEREIAIKNGN